MIPYYFELTICHGYEAGNELTKGLVLASSLDKAIDKLTKKFKINSTERPHKELQVFETFN